MAWGDYRPLGEDLRLNNAGRDKPVKLFVSVGGNEEDDMIGTAAAAAQTLRSNAANLDVTFQLFPSENHASVIPVAVTAGLRSVFK